MTMTMLIGSYCAESKNVEIWVEQIGQNTKNELFQNKISQTKYSRRASWYWWKDGKVIFLRVLLSTTECYMIITNILKAIFKFRRIADLLLGVYFLLRRVNNNCQHSKDYKFRRTVDLFQREIYRKPWFPTFTLEQGRVQIKDLKISLCFSGSKTSDPFNWGTWGERSSSKIWKQ